MESAENQEKSGENRLRLLSALESLEEIRSLAREKRLAVFSDYDGTLTPIVDQPENALLSPVARRILKDLSARFPVAVISGRDLRDIRERVNVKEIFYVGSHGFEIAFPDGKIWEHSLALDYLPVLDQAQNEIGERLKGIEGARIERKRFSLAVHYRLVPGNQVPAVEKVIHWTANNFPELRLSTGKKVYDLQPRIAWHKGKALLMVLEVLGLEQPDVLPLYIGDDRTDEDAFRVLKNRGVSILVVENTRATGADYSLKNPAEVQTFLLRILAISPEGKEDYH